jgi:membrane protease subunit (stomatin/prohibitin family)
MGQQSSFTSLIESASKLPLVHINREEFLTENLNKLCTPTQLQKAIVEGTLHADIPITTLDSLANAVINAETIKVTAISTAAGMPGGFAMAATIPADLAQFYGFVIRTAQELAYIYGWGEIFTESSELDANTESQLILFIGVMSGVKAANTAVTKLFGETAMNAVAKRVAAKALTKTWYYPIVKKIAAMLGQKMVKSTFAKGVSKAVPILGGAISGGLTLATFKPMAHRLQNHLSTMAHMSPDEFAKYEASTVIDAKDLDADGETVEVSAEEDATNCWVCTCGTKNKGKFCIDCGKAKPVGIPQYRCDKCGWEPDDKTHPPKFCPECGDPFDDGDIVLV